MILETYKNAEELVQYFKDKGIKLKSINSNLLGQLAINLQSMVQDGSVYMPDVQGPDSITPFTAMYDNYVNEISDAVNNHVSFARNIVLPEVNRFNEELNVRLKNISALLPEDNFEITYFSEEMIPDIAEITSELTSYNDNKDLDVNINAYYISLGSINDINLINYLSNGDSVRDDKLATWLISIGDDNAKACLGNDNNISETIVERFNRLAINYLFYKTLTDKADLETTLTKSDLRHQANILTRYYGTLTNYTLRDIKNLLGLNEIVIDKRTLGNGGVGLILNNHAFTSFVEGGGKLESIFGYMVDQRNSRSIPNTSVKSLLSNLERLDKSWANERFLHISKLNKDRLSAFKAVVHMLFDSFIDQPTEELKDIIKTENSVSNRYYITVKKLMNEYLNSITTVDMEGVDYYSISLFAVAKCLYYPTSAYGILNDIREFTRMDDRLDVREAALLATINYVVDYFCSMLVRE